MKVSKQETITMLGATIIVVFLLFYMYMSHFREETKLLQCEYYALGVVDTRAEKAEPKTAGPTRAQTGADPVVQGKNSEAKPGPGASASSLPRGNVGGGLGGLDDKYLERFDTLSPMLKQEAIAAFEYCKREL